MISFIAIVDNFFSVFFQDEDEEDEEQEGGLSKSGKELKKLLGKADGLNDSDADDDDDDEDVSVEVPNG